MKIHVQENKSGYKSNVKGIHLKNCFRLLNVGEMVIIYYGHIKIRFTFVWTLVA